jgi:hypothetical protein
MQKNGSRAIYDFDPWIHAGFDEFMHNYRLEPGDLTEDIQSIIVNLGGRELLEPLNFRYIAEAETK